MTRSVPGQRQAFRARTLQSSIWQLLAPALEGKPWLDVCLTPTLWASPAGSPSADGELLGQGKSLESRQPGRPAISSVLKRYEAGDNENRMAPAVLSHRHLQISRIPKNKIKHNELEEERALPMCLIMSLLLVLSKEKMI